ncbi:helix-turn-helix domain-containing protein [Phytohabitans kaempferiae]|uniref:Helix-turn-helix domain-containing protein n=1 Tax=Phytohabitans kaempferiae TaxID=1620943 RepID=A0ABV6LVH1_9ACTN
MSGNNQVRLDPTSLRGVAHPLRVRILGVLRLDGPATSTTLAERLGLSTGATSYHLRQLAAYGFVVEETGRGVGRERWWRAVHKGTVLAQETIQEAPAESEVYRRAVATTYSDNMERWLDESQVLPREWWAGSTLSDWPLRLTAAEAAELRRELGALIERYRSHSAPDAPEGAELVWLQIQLLPFVRRAEGG